jgi:hypothetical protein
MYLIVVFVRVTYRVLPSLLKVYGEHFTESKVKYVVLFLINALFTLRFALHPFASLFTTRNDNRTCTLKHL